MVACGSGSGSSAADSLHARIASTNNPLVASYTVTAPAQATVAIQFGPTTSYGLTTSAQPASPTGGDLSLLVAGMKQNTVYHMRALVNLQNGSQEFDNDHTFTTGPIPPGRIPSLAATTSNATLSQPGVKLISLTPSGSKFTCLATDHDGNVIWFYDYDVSLGIPQPIKLLPNGHMLMVLYSQGIPSGGTLREIDLAGNLVRELTFAELNQKLQAAGHNLQALSMDHDVVSLPNGHLLLILSDTRVFTDLPGYPGALTVYGNAVVDIDQNSNPVWVWDAFDHLDVNRHPIYFPDWTHANALAYSTDDGNLLLSLRHQSWILKIDYQNGLGSGDILWRLGNEGDFILDADSTGWFYAQHDANFASPNTTGSFQLALFDNGNYRDNDFNSFADNGMACAPGNPPLCYSAPAVFQVNEPTMTASRQWSHTMPFSWWGGVTQVLPNSNIFVDETAPVDLAPAGSRIQEITQDANQTVVWQMLVSGQDSYRTIHLPSLYPGVQW